MKKLWVLLFALGFVLLSGQAFGQAYSNTVLQNSAGNYGRPVPYPQVLVCVSSDTNVPCVTRATTYSDDTLTTQCTQTGSSGLLIGNPTSGANCNNPGIGDVNGNFTIYVAGGEYMICTYSGTWLCQKQTIGGGNSGSGVVNSCIGAHCDAYYPLANVPSVFGDPFATDDGSGNKTGKTFTTTQTGIAGFHYFTQGTAPILSVNNSVYFYAPVSVSTYAWVLPGVAGTGCLQGSNSSGIVTISFTGVNCGTSSITFQTNTVNNSSQSLLNLVNGTGITITNTSGGNVQITASGGGTQISTPTAPTLTVNGTTGATTYTYDVVGCENGPTCTQHTAASATTSVSNGNATLTSSNSITLSAYGDTLYGPRCFNIYRTVGGATQGLIANCVWKQFIDTGVAGDGTTAPVTNTTTLQTSSSPLPGCNSPLGAPFGVDGPPCSPNALDDEGTSTFGAPGDVNDPFWTWLNQNSAVSSNTGGVLSITSPSRSAADNLNCLIQSAPSTPYTFTALLYPNVDSGTASANFQPSLVFYESSSGKLETIGPQFQSGSQYKYLIAEWTNTTTQNGTFPVSNNTPPNPVYLRIQDDGTNLKFYTSPDGIIYKTALSQARGSFFTSAPNKVGFCVDNNSGASSLDVDYWRRTQ